MEDREETEARQESAPEAREPEASNPEAPNLEAAQEISELRARLRGKEDTIRGLHEELARLRLSADETRAESEAAEGRVESLERERKTLRERVGALESEARSRRRGRETGARRIESLEREVERLEGEVSHRDHLLRMSEEELESVVQDSKTTVSRKKSALEDALRRIAGLERDLEEREVRILDREAALEESHVQLEEERAERERLSEPANRLRAGLDVFNESRYRETVTTLSRTLGQPRVHVGLGRGEEPPVLLEFTWRGVSWRHFAANPGLAVEEPRVYVTSSGEDLSGVDERPPNAHVGPGARVLLGL